MTDPASRTVSLNDIGLKYIEALQRLSDTTVFAWAGSRTVSEQGYDEVFRAILGLPSTQFRLSFDNAREEADRWNLKHVVHEALGLSVVFLDDIRKLCGLITFNVARASASGDLASLAAELNSPSGPADLSGRLKQLRDRYRVAAPLEPELLSLADLGRCLFQRNGVVGEGETLLLKLKAVQPPAPGETQARLGDFERRWNSGEKVALSRQEHAAIFTTLSVFFGSMLGAVQEFAKNSGLPEEPVLQ